ncbi:MAG TPA: Asp-tRNA(Asn)/Glu-tRNA(Gln) amidotransferase subunit GatB [Gemmatales bacterium]|nr:Asp-tRNA(Asn)/Glu-tRNA(Gln) amidotransferase subunit GatB [Gemmatales bacterium]
MSNTALPYKIVVGLEVHVQLLTKTKLFCGCTTTFGLPPNSATCPICIGMPGVLPVMNRQAFELGMRAALALNCQVARYTKWDRKNYYYPDLPKNYQISQYDLPMSYEGWLEISTSQGTKKVGIIRAHLEEDAGKMLHDESGRGKDSQVDLNRAGTPLLEIVSHPHIHSGEEVKAYLEEIRLLLREICVSDCEMQEGSLRVDANVNVNFEENGKKVATPIVEVKNVNSIRAVERAVLYEAQRQYEQYQVDHVTMSPTNKVTAKWYDEQGRTEVLRRKEEAADYRYFPEPDLVTVQVDEVWLEKVKLSLGELPSQRRTRYVKEFQILESAARQIVGEGVAFCKYFEAVASVCGDGKLASNWCLNSVLQSINEHKYTINEFPLSAEKLGNMITQIKKYNINMARSREVFAQLLESNDAPENIVKRLGLDVTFDPALLKEFVKKSIASNPKAVADVKAGKTKAIDSLMGPVMRETKGKAPMDLVRQLLQEELEQTQS